MLDTQHRCYSMYTTWRMVDMSRSRLILLKQHLSTQSLKHHILYFKEPIASKYKHNKTIMMQPTPIFFPLDDGLLKRSIGCHNVLHIQLSFASFAPFLTNRIPHPLLLPHQLQLQLYLLFAFLQPLQLISSMCSAFPQSIPRNLSTIPIHNKFQNKQQLDSQ